MTKYEFYLAGTNGYNMVVAVDEKKDTAVYWHSDNTGKVWGIDIYNKDINEALKQLREETADADTQTIDDYAETNDARANWSELQKEIETLHKI